MTDEEIRQVYNTAMAANHNRMAALRAVAEAAAKGLAVAEARAAYWKAASTSGDAWTDLHAVGYDDPVEEQDRCLKLAKEADASRDAALATLRALGAEP